MSFKKSGAGETSGKPFMYDPKKDKSKDSKKEAESKASRKSK